MIKALNAKIVVANAKSLLVEWSGGFIKVTNLAAPATPLYNGQLYKDIVDFDDISIDDAGNGIFIVRTSTTATTPTDFSADNFEPKQRYDWYTISEVLEVRSVANFVTV